MRDKVPFECELVFEFTDEQEAETVASAIKIDNPDFVTLTIEGKILRSSVRANTLPSLINTLEDYLACIALAEKIINEQ